MVTAQVAAKCDDMPVKIARQLRLAGEDVPADVENLFDVLAARRGRGRAS